MPVRVLLLFSALIIYAVLGSPTPDNPGLTEAVIGAMLILAAGLGVFTTLLSNGQPGWKISLTFLFIYGFSIQVIVGLAYNHDSGTMLRDIAAFLFFLLPLFFFPLMKSHSSAHVWLERAIVFIGLSFSIRALLPVYGFYEAPDELLYLANSPLVLLTSLLLLNRIFNDIYQRTISLQTILYATLAIIPFAAMLIDVQRAPVAAVIMSIIFSLGYLVYFRPVRGFVVLMTICIVLAFIWPVFQEILYEILSKTSRVGLNMRSEELQAVISAIDGDALSVLFGIGWGSTFDAPSVGGLPVSYTHSLLSYVLLKGGVCGLALIVAFCFLTLRELWTVFRGHPVQAMALSWPFLIPVFLYASHKSLDFGLVLFFIFICAARVQADSKIMPQDTDKGGVSRFPALPNGAA